MYLPYLTNPSTLGREEALFLLMQWLPARFISFPPPLPQLTGGSCNKAVTVLLLLLLGAEADHLFKAHQGERGP